MYSLEQSSEVFEYHLLTNRSCVWPVYTLIFFNGAWLAYDGRRERNSPGAILKPYTPVLAIHCTIVNILQRRNHYQMQVAEHSPLRDA